MAHQYPVGFWQFGSFSHSVSHPLCWLVIASSASGYGLAERSETAVRRK